MQCDKVDLAADWTIGTLRFTGSKLHEQYEVNHGTRFRKKLHLTEKSVYSASEAVDSNVRKDVQ